MTKRSGGRPVGGNGKRPTAVAPAYAVTQYLLDHRRVALAAVAEDEARLAKSREYAAGVDEQIKAALRAGGVVEPGALTARLEVEVRKTGGDVRPSWKTEYLAHMEAAHKIAPDKAEDDVRARTEPGAVREERVERLVVEGVRG